MKEYQLKYGCNPNQKPASVEIEGRSAIYSFSQMAGRSYINL